MTELSVIRALYEIPDTGVLFTSQQQALRFLGSRIEEITSVLFHCYSQGLVQMHFVMLHSLLYTSLYLHRRTYFP
jgi:hypothetical protein